MRNEYVLHVSLAEWQAELENVRRRTQRDLENAHKYALEKFLNDLLPIQDSMEMGLVAAKDSIDPERTKLLSWLSVGSGAAILILIAAFFIIYIAFVFFAVVAAESGSF